MKTKVVSNTGPILHLQEINLTEILDIFPLIITSEEVTKELKKHKVITPKKIKIIPFKSHWKDFVKLLTNQENLDLGEAEAIALSLQEKAQYFLTDDLEARKVARNHNVQVHGTVGIILKAFQKKKIDKKTAIQKVRELHNKSSLFITQDLIELIIDAIKAYPQHKFI